MQENVTVCHYHGLLQIIQIKTYDITMQSRPHHFINFFTVLNIIIELIRDETDPLTLITFFWIFTLLFIASEHWRFISCIWRDAIRLVSISCIQNLSTAVIVAMLISFLPNRDQRWDEIMMGVSIRARIRSSSYSTSQIRLCWFDSTRRNQKNWSSRTTLRIFFNTILELNLRIWIEQQK